MDAGDPKRRRVLIVVSAWCPAIIADMQRARMLAWELPKLGWDVEVLTPRASEIRQDVIEPDARAFFAPETTVHEVGSLMRPVFEAMGSQTHAWRTLWTVQRRGRELLRAKRYDLVYFTTTTFVYFALGSRWYEETGVPYVLDFHDPWVRASAPAPGQSLRSRVAQRGGARMERDAVLAARGIVSVSPRYLDDLRSRYAKWNPPWLAPARNAVIAFGAREEDLARSAKSARHPPAHGGHEIVLRYVGVGGAIMARSFELLCRAMGRLRELNGPLADRVRIELYGTTYNWKAGDPKVLEAVAERAGVGDLVRERPERVTYRQSLDLLLDCDGALILGVDDAGYMPSKLFAYALSGKPLLASLHRESPAFAQFGAMAELGHVLWFDADTEMPLTDAARVAERYLREAASRLEFQRRAQLEPFLAPRMARRHVELFDACVHSP